MNIPTLPPYSNQPIKAIDSVVSGSHQSYTQRIRNSGKEFMQVLHDTLKAHQLLNNQNQTLLPKETTKFMQPNKDLSVAGIEDPKTQRALHDEVSSQKGYQDFFSLFNHAYHSLLGAKSGALEGLPTGFSGYFPKQIGYEKGQDTLFKEEVVSGVKTKKAQKAYSNTPSNAFENADFHA